MHGLGHIWSTEINYDAVWGSHPLHTQSIIFQQIEHFFTHYKDLEAEKWVRIGNWGDAEAARRTVLECIDRYKASKS